MVQIVLRNSKDETGTLAVRIVNRNLKINTYISMHLKIRIKDWSEAAQLPKNMYDERGVKELDGMSFSQLSIVIQDIKKLLTALDENNKITLQTARSVINQAVNKKKFEREFAAERDAPATLVKPTFIEFGWQYIKECEDGTRLKQRSSRKINPDSLRAFRSFLARMEEYQQAKKRVIDWDDFNFDFYNDFKQYYLRKNYSPNTVGRFIKNMKTILFAAKDMHLTTRDDFMSRKWSVDHEEVENIYIPEKRLLQMHGLDMGDADSLIKLARRYARDDAEYEQISSDLRRETYRRKLSEARDIFLLGCLVGQRVSDYKRISTDMIETIMGDRKFLHLVQVKTDKDVYIPYNDMIRDILAKYDGKLPKIFDQDLNEKIKVVGLLLGWTEPAGLTEHRGLMEYLSKKRFCDAIVTHTARRTFATNAYRDGVPLSAIMAVTGHSSEEMLRRYLKLSTKERALLAAEAFDKVKSVG